MSSTEVFIFFVLIIVGFLGLIDPATSASAIVDRNCCEIYKLCWVLGVPLNNRKSLLGLCLIYACVNIRASCNVSVIAGRQPY